MQPAQGKPLTVFWILKTTPEWLAKTPLGTDGRFEFAEKVFKPLLGMHPGASLRFFDTEAYSAEASDIMMWTVTDIADYNAVVEALRETPFWDRWFQIRSILPCLEDQYADHYGQERLQGEAVQ
jgi:hypothetical protein